MGVLNGWMGVLNGWIGVELNGWIAVEWLNERIIEYCNKQPAILYLTPYNYQQSILRCGFSYVILVSVRT